MDDFSKSILKGKPSRVSGEEGWKDLKVIEAIYASIRSGEAIKL